MHTYVKNRNSELCALCGYITRSICANCRKCSVCTKDSNLNISRDSYQVPYFME